MLFLRSWKIRISQIRKSEIKHYYVFSSYLFLHSCWICNTKSASGRYFWNFLKFRMSENRTSEIRRSQGPNVPWTSACQKIYFFCVVAGLTNLVWEKLEPLPRFSAVIEQKTDIWTEFWRFLTIFFRFLQKGLKLIYSEKATNFFKNLPSSFDII